MESFEIAHGGAKNQSFHWLQRERVRNQLSLNSQIYMILFSSKSLAMRLNFNGDFTIHILRKITKKEDKDDYKFY